MKKITLTLICGLMAVFTFAQDRKGQVRLKPGVEAHRLYVSFKTDIAAANNAAITSVLPEFDELTAGYGIVAKKGISLSETKLDEMEQQARRLTGSSASVSKLRNIVELTIENPTNERLLSLATALEKHEAVEYCSLMAATPVAPPSDIAPVTPLAEDMQGYLTFTGVKMDNAWEMGLTGEGINVRDIEYGFNANHEELNDVNAYLAIGMTISSEAEVDYTEHGTAVFGIVYGDKGDYGISGLAHGAEEMVLYPEWQEAPAGYNRVNAVSQCLENSSEGDVVIYEMQTAGAMGEFCQAEYDQVIWDLTKAASDTGVVIVAAAGNGSEDLDAPAYDEYNERGDSGAIIVGAGTDDEFHERLGFSTYGTRVDVQAWGQNVYSSGYGDAGEIGGDFNQAYTNFGGTSSATPIVASCVIVLQGYYHDLTGSYLTGPQLREVLKATGIPQGGGFIGNIGPFPDMSAAVAEIAALASAESFDAVKFIAYPNPVKNTLTLTAKDLSGTANAAIYTLLGQQVYNGTLGSEGAVIDFSNFAAGIYTVRVTDGNKVYTKKVVKQ